MNQDKLKYRNFVDRHKATIYTVCYMYADRHEEADDLFQETLINLWRGFSDFRNESTERTWVYRVSLNTCLSYKRKKKMKTEPLDISSEIFDNSNEVGAQTQMLHARISALEPMDRALVLLWLENMSYDEIGAILGVSAKNVGVRLVRIKEKLKKMNRL